MNTNRSAFEDDLAELLKQAYAENDLEVAEHLLRALEIVTRRNDEAEDEIDRLRRQAGRKRQDPR